MLGRLLAGSGRFGDVTGLDVTTLPGSGIRPRRLCTAATARAHEILTSALGLLTATHADSRMASDTGVVRKLAVKVEAL
jgi:hypothetical protein